MDSYLSLARKIIRPNNFLISKHKANDQWLIKKYHKYLENPKIRWMISDVVKKVGINEDDVKSVLHQCINKIPEYNYGNIEFKKLIIWLLKNVKTGALRQNNCDSLSSLNDLWLYLKFIVEKFEIINWGNSIVVLITCETCDLFKSWKIKQLTLTESLLDNLVKESGSDDYLVILDSQKSIKLAVNAQILFKDGLAWKSSHDIIVDWVRYEAWRTIHNIFESY